MSNDSGDKIDRIRDLNDQFRRTMIGGRFVMTAGVSSLRRERIERLVQAVRAFTAFGADNDPHGEHDFGSFELEGHDVFWKLEYYDLTLTHGSEDPSDPLQTHRVLTIMLAEDY